MQRPLCGIDEAGRGPLAGSLVMVGVILLHPIDGLNDSKQLTPRRRETLYAQIQTLARYHRVAFSSSQVDDWGISECLRRGLRAIMDHFGPDVDYLFDGNSTLGVAGLKSRIRADADVPEVSAASIVAKVTRDREMVAAAETYPLYGFERHKGYGTRAHIEAIAAHGRCPIHRHTFRIRQIDEPPLF